MFPFSGQYYWDTTVNMQKEDKKTTGNREGSCYAEEQICFSQSKGV